MPAENDPAIGAAQWAANPLVSMQPIGWWVRTELFGLLRRSAHAPILAPKPRVVTWGERDDWIIVCVKFGLNAREIVNLSYSWPQPITTTQQVYDKITQLHLERLYKRKDKKRAGAHNQNIIHVFSKITGQALEYRYRVTDVLRDAAPEGARFRPDLMLKIDRREFMVEVQLSKIEGTRWGEKFRNYIRLYEAWKRPFRVLILIDKKEDLPKVRRVARNQLKSRGHESLNLFYFLTLEQFRDARDVIKAPIWWTAWGGKPASLM